MEALAQQAQALRLALSGRFRARWRAQIHDEWKRYLLKSRGDLAGATNLAPATD